MKTHFRQANEEERQKAYNIAEKLEEFLRKETENPSEALNILAYLISELLYTHSKGEKDAEKKALMAASIFGEQVIGNLKSRLFKEVLGTA